MIRLVVQLPNRQVKSVDWVRPILTIGRAHTNDIVFPADNISGQHAQISLQGNHYVYRDLHSTNGTVLVRQNKRYLLKGEAAEMALEPGDRICLASLDHEIIVETIRDLTPAEDEDSSFENTILAEEVSRPAAEIENALGDDSAALRAAVSLARELAGVSTVHEVAELTCRACLKAFLRARRVIFLVPREESFAVEAVVSGEGVGTDSASSVLRSRQILDRCLVEKKGFIFVIEQNQMQAIATMIHAAESFDGGAVDRVILCCPLFHGDRCLGFIEIEAPLPADRQGFARRDLSLVTLMGHLVAARLGDLEDQRLRLKLARKATAGFMAAMVGHCFKNLLFVPNSLAKLLPLSISKGNMDEVKWILARNSVNIRYLDILSNEFAAASKDPTQGFEPCSLDQMLVDVANLMNQIAPERVETTLSLPVQMPRLHCHGGALRRLIMNLTLNSVDAFFGSNVTEKGRIDLSAECDEDRDEVRITVRDNGPGIPEPILNNLREIFTQVQTSADALGELQNIAERVRSTKEKGFKEHYGLGFLFVCQTVCAHGGRLEIESAPGKGARFDISLPRKTASTHPGTVAEDESQVQTGA